MNIINEWYVEAANHTCGPFDPDVDEMELAGLTPVPSEKVCTRHRCLLPGLNSVCELAVLGRLWLLRLDRQGAADV